MREVILAKSAGFCFGVQRAVEEALKIKETINKKIYTLGPLIHNNDVVTYLEEKDIYAIDLSEIDNLADGDTIIIRSHGVSKAVMDLLNSKGLKVIDATCPFVTNIHRKVEKHSKEGYSIVILGDEDHPEVIGINGWCDNKGIITKEGKFMEKLPQKVCVVSQTTEKEENWKNTMNNLSTECREVLAFNTICSATEVRQKSVYELSQEVDCMIVVGGKNSSNTTKLYEIAKANCENTIHIENVKELPIDIIENVTINKVGVTAGASTPKWIIDEVICFIEDSGDMEEQLILMNESDKKFKIGDIVEGEVLTKNNNEVTISLIGYKIDGIIPIEELGEEENIIDTINIGDKIKAKVIKLLSKDGYVILSKLEFDKEKAKEELEEKSKNGSNVRLKVVSTGNNGLITSFKGVRVFIPSSQIGFSKGRKIEDYKDKYVEARIIEYDRNNHYKNIASTKIVQDEEKNKIVSEVINTISIGDIIEVEIKRFTKFGAFGDYKGVDCLIHISEISYKRLQSPSDVLEVGEVVKTKVIDVKKEQGKVSLSIKALLPEPWERVEEKYPVGSIVLGTVARITDFGAFIELEPNIDGLVHISKIAYEKISNPNEKLTIGETVKAKILSVNSDEKKISLSIKDA